MDSEVLEWVGLLVGVVTALLAGFRAVDGLVSGLQRRSSHRSTPGPAE